MIKINNYHNRFCYTVNNKTVCVLKYEFRKNEIYISNLQTLIKYRHKGYASLVLKEFLKWATTQNLPITMLAVPLDSEYNENKLIAYYNEFGFIHDDRKTDKNFLIYEVHK